jgi:hypothetical protein
MIVEVCTQVVGLIYGLGLHLGFEARLYNKVDKITLSRLRNSRDNLYESAEVPEIQPL